MVLRLDARVVVQRSNIMDFNALDFLYAVLDLLPILKDSLEKALKDKRAYVFGKKGNG